MTSDLLRDELLSLPGVESAVIEGDALTPDEVRVHLAAGVDATTVGEEVKGSSPLTGSVGPGELSSRTAL